MYREFIKDKFPHDESVGMYKFPKLPAVKLGKALMKDTRISSPNDVVAMHIDEGTFSSRMVIFTDDHCYYDDGAFLLEDVKEITCDGRKLSIVTNQKGQYITHEAKVKNDQVAHNLKKIFEGIIYFDPVAQEMVKKTYEGFSTTELDWLNLRDEVMKTIDMLYDRYNDGKLSMLDYEEKKAELLSRL